jgi:hypothetical protein
MSKSNEESQQQSQGIRLGNQDITVPLGTKGSNKDKEKELYLPIVMCHSCFL